MPVIVKLYSVYVEGQGVKLFNRAIEAVAYKKDSEGSDVTVWGTGKHEIEVTNCIEAPELNESVEPKEE